MPGVIQQLNLLAPQPTAVAYGLGVDSTAMLVGMKRRGWVPDVILNADMNGCERTETDDYVPVMNEYLQRNGFPEITRVRYVPRNFKHWPPYYSLLENCLTNGTLPSIAFGFHSCSQKWKIAPQDNWCKEWPLARNALRRIYSDRTRKRLTKNSV